MLRPKPNFILACLIALSSAVAGLAVGCNSNPNETEFLRNASPGTPAQPESVASRRERTKNVPKVPVKSSSARRN
jgi:hypothetical protein